MQKRWLILGVVVACAAGLFVGQSAVAQEGGEGCGCGCAEACGCGGGCGGGEGGGMPMPEWMKPTKEHAEFEKQVGTWDAKCEFREAPGGAAMQMTGVATTELILNGYFVRQTFKGEFFGKEFTGIMHLGYDTVNKEYVSTWMEDMSPYLYVSRGKEKDGAIVFEGQAPDHMTGEMKTGWSKLTWKNDDQYTFEMYGLHEGKKFKSGQIVYTRRK